MGISLEKNYNIRYESEGGRETKVWAKYTALVKDKMVVWLSENKKWWY